MSNYVATFDHLEQDAWTPRNDTSVNPIPFDYLPVPSLVTTGAQAGSLLFMAAYSKNLAGGLISRDIPLPPPYPGRTFAYVALNIKQWIPPYPDGTVPRNENDLKWTLFVNPAPPAPQLGNQGNISTQIGGNGDWQLDPTGKAWVTTGYTPTSYKTGQNNVFQIRAWSNGTVWSVTGLQMNSEAPFTPGAAFQNIPLIVTNWSSGLHPQLQWEGGNAPFSATVYYGRVQVSIGDAPIPMIDSSTF